MILDKNKVEEAANNYSLRIHSEDDYDILEYNAFEAGISYAESQLSELAIEFGKFISNHRLDFQPGDVAGEGLFIGLDMKYYSSEELFKEFLKQRDVE